MKLTEFTQVTALDSTSILLIDGTNGTKKILTKDAILAMLSQISPESPRMIYRGKNLGSSFTAVQKATVNAGVFDDIFLGDYWIIGGVTYRVADFNYFLRCVDTDFTSQHLVLVPDTGMYSGVMNDTNITTGGYVGSKMYTEGLAQAKTTRAAAFGDAVLTHREYLTNAVTNGYPSAGAWFDSTVELMSERMCYGNGIYMPAPNGTILPTNYTVAKSQLALFQAVPKFIHNRTTFWLRDVVSDAGFALVGSYGDATSAVASLSVGVRPVFLVG